MGKTQYDTRTDAVIYGCDATASFTPADWIRLAMAALDQAGVSAIGQAAVRQALWGRYGGGDEAVDIAAVLDGAPQATPPTLGIAINALQDELVACARRGDARADVERVADMGLQQLGMAPGDRCSVVPRMTRAAFRVSS